MLSLQHTYNNTWVVDATARVLGSLSNLQKRRYRSLSGYAFLVLLVVALYGLSLPLFLLRKPFAKRFSKLDPNRVFNNPDVYVKYKKRLAQMHRYSPSMEDIAAITAKHRVWYLAFPLKEFQFASKLMLAYRDGMQAMLDKYNSRQFQSESTEFSFVTEKELWENRNHAYDYWM